MTKATVEQIKKMFDFGALGWESILEDGTEAYLYSAKIVFPSRSSSKELNDGLFGLVGKLMGNSYVGTHGPPVFDDDSRYSFKYENRDRKALVLESVIETSKFQFSDKSGEAIFGTSNIDEKDKDRYMLNCEIYVSKKSDESFSLVANAVAEFVHQYGNIEAPKSEKVEPIVPYQGREINLEAEVAKINIKKLKEEYLAENAIGRFEGASNLGMGIYLVETGRLRPDNAIMVMTYEGKGIFTILSDWDEVNIDPRTNLIRRNSMGRNFEYFQIDYEGLEALDIGIGRQKVDKDVTKAVMAYAIVSGIIAKHGKFNPFEIKNDAPPETKSMFPQKLLDFNKSDSEVRAQVLEYLRG